LNVAVLKERNCKEEFKIREESLNNKIINVCN
jgi:hypothetical protein